MNLAESKIHYANLAVPEPAQRTAVAPGVWWIRMPLPFALDHINLWLLEDQWQGQIGYTVVDTGVSTAETRTLWKELVSREFQGLPIVRVICTHMHPDHLGLAHWLCEGMPHENDPEGSWQAPLWMTLGEFSTGRIFSSRAIAQEAETAPDGPQATMAEHFRRHGMTSQEDYEKAIRRKSHFPTLVPRVPLRYHRIMPHQTLEIGGDTWEVIPGYGHSPEHASLFCSRKNLLISGDMVLPRISTNMSVWAHEPEADPLGMYLDSLKEFDRLPDDVLVLPSHGKPFGGKGMQEIHSNSGAQEETTHGAHSPSPSVPAHQVRPHTRAGGLHTRLQQLHDHHEERLEKILAFCSSPVSCAEVLPVLFPRALDFHQFTFAMGETIAHMNHLWHKGIVDRSLINNTFRFSVK